MASNRPAKRQRLPPRSSRIRHRIESECETVAEKDALATSYQRVREQLSPHGSHVYDNSTLLHAMFDIVEQSVVEQPPSATGTATTTHTPSMMRNSGETIYTNACMQCTEYVFIMHTISIAALHNARDVH